MVASSACEGGGSVYENNPFSLLSMAADSCDAQLATNRHRSPQIWYKDPCLAPALH